MKNIFLFIFLNLLITSILHAQDTKSYHKQDNNIHALIDQYVQAREKKDTVLLKNIITPDIDQLVSSGEWRVGTKESMVGMMKSSESNPGTRTIRVEKIRYLDPGTAIVDAKYEIQNTGGSTRKMWSTFIVIFRDEKWQITAIRNMLPSVPQ
jgi:uncharacterized protein (TIGR02246 family)